MRPIALAALLPLLLAAPTAAQQRATHEGGCTVHNRTQMRCALSIPMAGTYEQLIRLQVYGSGNVSGEAQGWMSECGVPGNGDSVRSVSNSNRVYDMRRSTVIAASFGCPEVFIFNCRNAAGGTVPCSDGFSTARIRVEHERR